MPGRVFWLVVLSVALALSPRAAAGQRRSALTVGVRVPRADDANAAPVRALFPPQAPRTRRCALLGAAAGAAAGSVFLYQRHMRGEDAWWPPLWLGTAYLGGGALFGALLGHHACASGRG